MNMQLLIQNIKNGEVYDITQLTTSITYETDIGYQPGKLEIEFATDPNIVVNEGDVIRFKIDNTGIFFGKIFSKKKKRTDATWKIVAFDSLYYLKNEDTIVFEASTSSDMFTKICSENELENKVVDASSFMCPPKVQDKKSYFSMLQEAIDLTLINTGNWYILRDNFGTLEHVELETLATNLLIGHDSLATDFDFESTITDSFNYIKLTKDNEETNKREVFVVKDSKNIANWGKLQYHETVDAKMNEQQIQEKAERLLKVKNTAKRTLKVDCVGFIGIVAGSGVYVNFPDLQQEGIEQNSKAIVSKCTHKFGKFHEMTLELKVVQ